VSAHLGFLEASVVGLFQGVAELFPVSSLGHSILIPALVGGSWARDLSVSNPESPYLAFIVGLHVATAIALIIYYRQDWVRIVRGLLTAARDREIRTSEQHLGVLLVLATIPVGLVGLLFEHPLRTHFATPLAASIFLVVNAFVLGGAELLRRRSVARAPVPAGVGGRTPAASARSIDALDAQALADDARAGVDPADPGVASDVRITRLGWGEGIAVGAAQIGALFAGISRSGITMAAGLLRGLSHEDAARFSFLLATPVILAAGVLKLPDLFGTLGDGIRGQVLLGSVLSGLGAYVAVRFLTRYFETRTLIPFAVYCFLFGGFCVIRFA